MVTFSGGIIRRYFGGEEEGKEFAV